MISFTLFFSHWIFLVHLGWAYPTNKSNWSSETTESNSESEKKREINANSINFIIVNKLIKSTWIYFRLFLLVKLGPVNEWSRGIFFSWLNANIYRHDKTINKLSLTSIYDYLCRLFFSFFFCHFCFRCLTPCSNWTNFLSHLWNE